MKHHLRIAQLTLKLHQGFIWMKANPKAVDINQSLIERAKPIIEELKNLDVPEEVSLGVLLKGAAKL